MSEEELQWEQVEKLRRRLVMEFGFDWRAVLRSWGEPLDHHIAWLQEIILCQEEKLKTASLISNGGWAWMTE